MRLLRQASAIGLVALVAFAHRPSRAADPTGASHGPVSVKALFTIGNSTTPSASFILAPGDVVPAVSTIAPAGTDELRLQRFVLHLDGSALGQLALGGMESVRFVVYQGAPNKDHVIASDVIPTDSALKKDPVILTFDGSILPDLKVVPLTVAIRGEFSNELLCGLESVYRAKQEKTIEQFYAESVTPEPNTIEVYSGKAADRKLGLDKRPRARKVITGKDPAGREIEILFSFCGDYSIDWEKTAKNPIFGFGNAPLTGHELSDVHKQRLVEVLSEKVLDPFARGGSKVQVAPPNPADTEDKPHGRTRVFVEHEVSFGTAREPHPFIFSEAGTLVDGRDRDLDRYLIDQNSRIRVKDTGGCPHFGAPLAFRVHRPSEATAPVVARIGGGACEGLLDIDLKQFLGSSVVISATYEFSVARFDPPDKRTVILKQANEVQIANLGLITTFPVISEVVSAVNAKSPADISSTSSVPVSWVFGLGSKVPDSMAVTFPWKLSYNFRAAPSFAKYVGIYPHISVIVPTGSSADAGGGKLATGVGVYLAEVFFFTWAVKPGTSSSSPVNYLLVGFSIPDIMKLIQGK